MQPKFNSFNKADLRATTVSNNLVWLRSFGCTIERQGKLVFVHHPKLKEFSACLVVDNNADNLSQLESALARVAASQTAPDVYLDSEVKDGSIRGLLADEGFLPVLTSVITAVAIREGKESQSISLERAGVSQRALWCAMYSEGFGRTSEVAIEQDLERWSETFASEEVHNWFFVENGRRIGVCQTCTANGVIGVYSVALLPSERGFTEIISVLRALQAKLVLDGERIAYFERIQKIDRPPRRVGFLEGSSMTVREFTVYRRLRQSVFR